MKLSYYFLMILVEFANTAIDVLEKREQVKDFIE
jgi:hypothetical protein